jgi:hypothetical protein
MDVARQLSIPERSHLPSHVQRVKSWEQTGLWLLSTASHRLTEILEQSEERYGVVLLSKKIFAEGIWDDPGISGLYRVGTLHFELQVSRVFAESALQLLEELTTFYGELFSSHGFALQGRLVVD